MAMVNVNNLLNIKDSRWLQLEVCREFQRNKCSRPDTECKFAHPPTNVEVQNGRVTACYDSIKGRCNREKPPCKYFHPPHHLKDQLLINGRNHLALKNALMQQMGLAPGQPVVPGQVPAVQNPYLGVTSQAYNPYFAAAGPLVPLVSDPTGATVLGVPQQNVVQQKISRDRLETYPGMVAAYKRPAGDKSGVPVYQPNTTSAAAYQQLMQLQQPFVPVSSTSIQHSNATMTTGASTNSLMGGASAGAVQQGDHSSSNNLTGLANGNLDHASGGAVTSASASTTPTAANELKRISEERDENEANDHLQDPDSLSNSLLSSSNNNGGAASNDLLNDDDKESANKRMRVGQPGASLGVVASQQQQQANAVQNHVGGAGQQNNAAYVAAAQSYHNALAAMNYTGIALQTNKAQQGQGGVPGGGGYNPQAAVAAAAAAAAFQHQQQQHHHHQQHQHHQAQQQGAQNSYAGAGSQGQQQQQQQQQQQVAAAQQQLLSQYQAMAAALANQGAFQGASFANQQVATSVGGGTSGVGNASIQAGSSQGLNALNLNAASGLSLAGMNPLLASIPGLAAAQQRATLFANQQAAAGHQGALSLAQFNPAALGLSAGGGGGTPVSSAGAVGFPFGVQFAAAPSAGSAGGAGANAHPFQSGNQQALLAAYGQFARASVPVAVSAAPQTMSSQQLAYVSNPAAAAGTAVLQGGVKRLRPQ